MTSQEGSEEKGLAMTTGLDILQLYGNFTNSGLLFAYGRPYPPLSPLTKGGIKGGWCRRQALFLHSLLAVLILFIQETIWHM